MKKNKKYWYLRCKIYCLFLMVILLSLGVYAITFTSPVATSVSNTPTFTTSSCGAGYNYSIWMDASNPPVASILYNSPLNTVTSTLSSYTTYYYQGLCSQGYSPINYTNLVAYYSFQGNNETPLKVLDRSGYGNNGSWVGGYSFYNGLNSGSLITSQGRVGNAINFTPNNNDKAVIIGNITEFPYINISDKPFTWMAWVKKDDATNYTGSSTDPFILTSGYNTLNCPNGTGQGCGGAGFYVYGNWTGFDARLTNNSYSGVPKLVTWITNFAPGIGVWHHYAVTHNGTRGTNVTFYIDGQRKEIDWILNSEYWNNSEQMGLPLINPNAVPVNATRLMIGQSAHTGNGLNGSIDGVCIYNRSLTSTEIYTNYNSSSPFCAVSDGKVLDYSFENYNSSHVLDDNAMVAGVNTISTGAGRFDNKTLINITSTNLNLQNMTGWSVCSWAKPDMIGEQTIISFSNSSKANNFIYMLYRPSGEQFGLGWRNSSDTASGAITSQISIVTNWAYLCLIYNSSNINLYLNGALENTTALTMSQFNAFTDMTIGARVRTTTGQYFNGSIDEVTIWNRSLSTNEIKALYNWQNKNFEMSEVGSYNYVSILPVSVSSPISDIINKSILSILIILTICFMCGYPAFKNREDWTIEQWINWSIISLIGVIFGIILVVNIFTI